MRYFDHNATSVILPEARAAWVEAAEGTIGNPSSPHRIGARASKALEGAREELAGIVGCDPLDVVWTSGATESNNFAVHHLGRNRSEGNGEMWISAIEHPCVVAATEKYFAGRRRQIPVSKEGIVDLEWLEVELRRVHPSGVAVMAANNETGVLQPWDQALRLCRAAGVRFFCDATQWMGKRKGKGLGDCDFTSGSAHKFGGPRGVGFIKCPSGRLEALLVGGGQEEGRRAGTENVPGILAMMAALQKRESQMMEESLRARLEWKRKFEATVRETIPGAVVVGAGADRLWNTTMLIMPELECQQRWVVKMDKRGFAVSTGSACASGKEEPSPVLLAMGFAAAEASRAIRFSSGWETVAEDWEQLAEGLREVYEELRAGGIG